MIPSFAAISDGSAFRRSASQIFALIVTSSSMARTLLSSAAAEYKKKKTTSISILQNRLKPNRYQLISPFEQFHSQR